MTAPGTEVRRNEGEEVISDILLRRFHAVKGNMVQIESAQHKWMKTDPHQNPQAGTSGHQDQRGIFKLPGNGTKIGLSNRVNDFKVFVFFFFLTATLEARRQKSAAWCVQLTWPRQQDLLLTQSVLQMRHCNPSQFLIPSAHVCYPTFQL